jgi:hypothetical protein
LINPDGLIVGSGIGGQPPEAGVAMTVAVRVGVAGAAAVDVASARRIVATGESVGVDGSIVAVGVAGGIFKMTARANFVGAPSVGSGAAVFAASEHARAGSTRIADRMTSGRNLDLSRCIAFLPQRTQGTQRKMNDCAVWLI